MKISRKIPNPLNYGVENEKKKCVAAYHLYKHTRFWTTEQKNGADTEVKKKNYERLS